MQGPGVFALRQFRKGEFIFRRRYGPIVSNAKIRSLTREDRRHLCELDYETSAVLLLRVSSSWSIGAARVRSRRI
jgi:hypothetical protein